MVGKSFIVQAVPGWWTRGQSFRSTRRGTCLVVPIRWLRWAPVFTGATSGLGRKTSAPPHVIPANAGTHWSKRAVGPPEW